MEVQSVFVSQSRTASKVPWPGTGVTEDDAVPSPVGTHRWKWPGGHQPCGPWHSELAGAAAGIKTPITFLELMY